MEVTFIFPSIPPFAKALKIAAPKHLMRAMGKAFFKIGKSDIERMKATGLSGLNIKSKGLRNSFKFKATDSREAKSVADIKLSEYTGAKLFRIFQTGGDVKPQQSRTLTILTDAARTSGGKRKYSQKELSAMIASKQAKIIQTKAGPAIIKVDEKLTKSGQYRLGSKLTILAWLKPMITQGKRIDFYNNFSANSAAHDQLLEEAADEAIERTIQDEEFEGEE